MDVKNFIAVIIFVFTLTAPADAQPAGFPNPPLTPNHLFYLQRTPNKNTIMCELNYKSGKLAEDEPVHVYWLRYTENGEKAELSFIQRKFAYGMKCNKITAGRYQIYFVSYKKFKMELKAGADKKYHAFAVINNKESILTKIYLHINGGTFWSPNVEYVDVTGVDPASGQVVKERKKI
jgi:Domain of unknown function (DUF4833)